MTFITFTIFIIIFLLGILLIAQFLETRGDIKEWRNERGKLHRENAPAKKYPSGTKEWWLNGKRHRIDGPAYKGWKNKEWWVNGVLHRIDGPAIERHSGTKRWYYHGKKINCSSQEEFERIINLLPFE